MSAAETAIGLVRTVFTFKERLDDLGRDLDKMGDRLARLADSHAALRDRVSRIEGIIEGAAMASGRNPQPRITE